MVENKSIAEFICHNYYPQNDIDRVYIAQVFHASCPNINKGVSMYYVVQKWGRRNCQICSELKGGWQKLQNANTEACRMFKKVLDLGYTDITSSLYNGPLKDYKMKADIWLERWLADSSALGQEAVFSKSERPVNDEPIEPDIYPASDFTVVCINALGMDGFSENGTYKAETHEEHDFYWVTNDRGKKVECLAERFKVWK